MASYNRVILMGNLTRDVDLKYTQSGMAVTNFGIAVNEKRKQGDQWVDDPCFIDVTAWGKTAEVAGQYLSKGSPVFIEGRLKLDTWEKDGTKHSKLKVTCDRLQLIGSKGEGGSRAPQSSSDASYSPEPQSGFTNDEIPF